MKLLNTLHGFGSALAGVAIAFGLSACSSEKEVPNLVDLDLTAARARIREAGFEPGDVETIFTGNKESAIVLKQIPKPAEKMPKHTKIYLTVEDSVTVPALVGQPYTNAIRVVQALGLTFTRAHAPKDDRAEGAVVAQKPAPGTRVAAGAAVLVELASGKNKGSASSGKLNALLDVATEITQTAERVDDLVKHKAGPSAEPEPTVADEPPARKVGSIVSIWERIFGKGGGKPSEKSPAVKQGDGGAASASDLPDVPHARHPLTNRLETAKVSKVP